MSAHVLLKLLNELGKRYQMRGLPSILSLFRNEFNKSNKSRARMLDSIYHMAFRFRPLAGYGLPPPQGVVVDHIFLNVQCLAMILQHVSPLTMAALSCNSLLHTLPYKIFDN